MKREAEQSEAMDRFGELLKLYPDLMKPILKFAGAAEKIRREERLLDEIEDRFVVAERELMGEMMQAVVSGCAEEVTASALAMAETKRYRKKSC